MVKPRTVDRDHATEVRILNAAHAVFTRRGTAGARVQEIADEAGVNKALLHYYFRSKEKLATAVFQRVAVQVLPPLVEILSSDLEIEAKVERVVNHYIDRLTEAPYLPAYLIGEVNHHPERVRELIEAIVDPDRVRPQLLGTLGRQIEARVQQRSMRPIAPEQFVVNLLALCVFPFAMRPMLQLMFAADDAAFEAFIARRRTELVQFFLGALRP